MTGHKINTTLRTKPTTEQSSTANTSDNIVSCRSLPYEETLNNAKTAANLYIDEPLNPNYKKQWKIAIKQLKKMNKSMNKAVKKLANNKALYQKLKQPLKKNLITIKEHVNQKKPFPLITQPQQTKQIPIHQPTDLSKSLTLPTNQQTNQKKSRHNNYLDQETYQQQIRQKSQDFFSTPAKNKEKQRTKTNDNHHANTQTNTKEIHTVHSLAAAAKKLSGSYNPTNARWRNRQCKKLDLTNEQQTDNPIPKELKALKKKSIQSDGNCFFRAISVALTGHENEYRRLRKTVINSMIEGKDNHLHHICTNYESDETYIITKRMHRSGTYATETEFQLTANLLNTTIAIYAKYGNDYQWLYFKPKDANNKKPSIYLQLHNEHIEVLHH